MGFLQIAVMTIFTLVAVYFGVSVLKLFTSGMLGLAIVLLRVPGWIRWLLLIPVAIFTFFTTMVAFELVSLPGAWFGESFFGTLWTWFTTLTLVGLIPTLVVTNTSIVAPKGRIWVAIGIMLYIWLTLSDTFLAPPPDVQGFDFQFHGALVVAVISSIHGVGHVWTLTPILKLMEIEKGPFKAS